MTTFFPTWRVDGPPPIRPTFGLLQAAEADAAGVRIVVDVDNSVKDLDDLPANVTATRAGMERWMSGVAVWPYPPDLPELWDACAGASSGQGSKSFGTPLTPPEFAAFTVVVPETCTSQQIPDQDEYRARAVRVMAAVEGYGVEQSLLTGDPFAAGQPFLADSNCVILNGGNVTKPNFGVQVLEEAIAFTGRLGIIHCSPMLATALLGNGFALSDKTGVIRTINGNVVIPGYGYAQGATPVGAAAPGSTQEWAYCTGTIDIRRSEIFVTPDTLAQALDRGTPGSATNSRSNTITYRAERYYVVDWDTALQAAVLIDRCGEDCNPGS